MTVISNLRQTNPSANQETQKVYFEEETLTIGSLPQFNAHKLVSFKEVTGFWQLPQSMLNKNIVPTEGTVVQVTLSTKPKPPGPNTKEGSKYMDIESMARMKEGTQPTVERGQSQHSAPQSGGSWDSEPATTSEPFVDKWDLKDIHIRKAQALNLLTEVLTSGDKVNAPKIVVAMGFTDAAEAIDAVANGWNSLRRGLPIEFPVAVSDLEEEEVAEDSPMVEAAVDLGSDVIEEDVESVSWD